MMNKDRYSDFLESYGLSSPRTARRIVAALPAEYLKGLFDNVTGSIQQGTEKVKTASKGHGRNHADKQGRADAAGTIPLGRKRSD